jgi:hypothetical protein
MVVEPLFKVNLTCTVNICPNLVANYERYTKNIIGR